MEKTRHFLTGDDRALLRKIVKVMKLTTFLLLVSTMMVSASLYSQGTKLTLNLAEASFQEMFQEIENQTEFRFAFSSSKLDPNQKVKVDFKNKTLEEILDKTLPAGIGYEIVDRYVVILNESEKKSPPEMQQLSRTITGRVVDTNGEPIPGVSIVLKGTTTGTISDMDGNFTLAGVTGDGTLVFSFVGMRTQEIVVGRQTSINVTLEQEIVGLEEVVAVGYGIQKRVTVTGAVSSVKAEELVKTKNENLLNIVTGKIPGVRVVQRSSEPGSFNSTFDIRGLGSPLIIIDGVPRDNISRLNPNEIESMSVLKDASAAIYGVRAANGVVLITTKKGKSGKTELNYSYNLGMQQPLGLPQPADAITQMTLMNEKTMTNFNNPFLQHSDAEFELYRSGQKQSSDWETVAIKDVAPMYQHNLSASGSNNTLNYYFNFGYLNQDGYWKSNDLNYKRYNVRANVEAQISKRLKTEMKLSGILDNKDQPFNSAETIFKSLWRQSATSPVFANNNPLYPGDAFDAANTVVITNSDLSGYRKYGNKWFQGSLALTYDIPYITGLSTRGMFSYDYNTSVNKSYRKEYSLYSYDPQNETYTPSIAQSPSAISREFYEKSATLLQLSLNYQRQFYEKHNVTALLLYEEGSIEGDNFMASRELSLPIDQLFAGNQVNQIGNMDLNGLYKFANKALVGKFNYDYASRYIAEFSFRYDGSSKFKKGAQWGFFPAVSVGWRISEEAFMRNSSTLSFINNLKFRASYGKMGDDGAAAYQFLTGYDYPSSGYLFNGNFINGIGFRGMPNYNITWYTAETANLGVDATLWKGLLGIQLDVFQRDRNGLLGNRLLTIPGTVGASMPQENLNSDRSRGYELMLTHQNKVGAVNLNLSAIFSYTNTQTRYFERAALGNSYLNWRNNNNNRNNNIWWGVESNGVYNSYSEIYSNSVNQGGGNIESLPGDYKYIDWNDDGVIDGNDDHPIGLRNVPLINYSFTTALDYKGFDVNLLFQGSAMTYVQYGDQLVTPFPWGNGNILTMFLDRWHPVDPNADRYDPTTVWVAGNRPPIGRPTGMGTAAVENASYLRLKSAEIGYTLPKPILSKIGIEATRIYLNGYNLLTFTGIKYLDPEHPSDTYGLLYPISRTFNVGISVNF